MLSVTIVIAAEARIQKLGIWLMGISAIQICSLEPRGTEGEG
jgi:hypothetical protein